MILNSNVLWGGELRLLLVDDETDTLEQTKIFLKKEVDEISVETASSAEKALNQIKENDYDAIVSDYQMPGMDGLEFLEAIREDKNLDIPFIIFTGRGREEVAMKALNLGADRYLQKRGDPKSQYGVLADAIIQETAHRKVQEEKKELEAGFTSLIKGSQDSICILNKDFNIIFANQAKLNRIGKNLKQIKGKKLSTIHSKENVEAIKQSVEKVFETGKPQRQITKHKDSGEYYDRTISPIKDPETGEVNKASIISKDITSRKKMEENLKQYKMAIEGSKNPIAAVDKNYNYLLANKAYLKYHNIEKEKIEGINAEKILGEQLFKEKVKPHLKQCLEGEHVEYKMRREHPNLGKRTLKINYHPLKNDEVHNIIIIINDITEQKETEKKFKTLFNETPEPLLILTGRGTVLNVNSRFEQVFGYKLDEIKGENINDLIVPDRLREEGEKLDKKALAEYVDHETVREGKEGEIPVSVSSTPIRLGNKTRIISTYKDISDRKKKEKELRESKEKYKMVTENINDSITIVDQEGEIIYVNEANKRLFGYEPEDVIGENAFELFHPEDRERVKKSFKKGLKKGEKSIEARFKCSDGSYKWIESSGRFLSNGKALIVTRDITARKKAEEREEFIHSLLRHDVRNKAQIVNGYLGLLEEFDLPEEANKYLKNAENAVDNSIEIIEKVRTIRKAQQEAIKEIKITKIMEKAVKQLKETAKENNVEIQYNHLEEVKVKGGELLTQAFTNIIENAIQHSKGNKIKIHGKTTEQKITCIIEDNGKGIPNEKKNKVFKKEYTTDQERGTGLGLYLVKNLLKTYKGEIKVKDSKLGGTRFDIHLQKA